MNSLSRGLAALSVAAALATGPAAAQAPLASERDKASYMVGMDVGRSVAPAAADLDLAALEKAIANAFAGGKPLLADAEAQKIGPALMQRVGARSGRPVPGLAPGAEPPAVDKVKVGYLIGADVGRNLQPLKDEVDLPLLMAGLRDTLAGGTPRLAEAEADAVRKAFATRVQAKMQAKAAEEGRKNAADGAAFLAKNGKEPGVVTTASGLQYRVLRAGSGQRPMPTDKVRVHYQGALLDGSVFDSSYERNQPAEFGLDQVIKGWTEGVGLMPVGSKYRLWVPASIGYGERGSPPSIPPNSTLVFDVELMQVL